MSNTDYTFESFVIGPSNRFAAAACQAVVQESDSPYNPLWLYGPSGCGKTHLMLAVLSAAKERNPSINTLYIPARDLAEQLAGSACGDEPPHVYDADILAVDNAECLSGMTATQERLAILFEDKQRQGGQVLFASNRPPKELKVLSQKIYGRKSGLFADIKPAEYELRREFAERLLREQPFDITAYALDFLAANLEVMTHIKGAMQTALFWSIRYNKQVDVDWAKKHADKY